MDKREKEEFPKLYNFFIKKNNIKKIMTIISRQDKVSLSLIEFFIMKYSISKNILLNNNKFNVYNEYKKTLSKHSKKYFDLFNRGGKIISIDIGENITISTTFKQLNFLYWVIKSNILNYVIDNYDDIKMEQDKLKKKKSVRKIKYIKKSKIVEKTCGEIIITFD